MPGLLMRLVQRQQVARINPHGLHTIYWPRIFVIKWWLHLYPNGVFVSVAL